MAATPKGGWPAPPNNIVFRLMIVFIGLLVVLPILVTSHLYAERRRNLDKLSEANSLAEARNSQLEEANRRARYSSLHDDLTGLPNRRYLMDHLGRLEADMSTMSTRLAVLHIDLDRFKQVNDAYGHATGDRLLQHAANLMRAVFRSDDIVARIGGDEFVAVCVSEEPETLARMVAGDLIAGFRHPIDLGDMSCRSGVSIGIACSGLRDSQPYKLLIDADIALYRAKKLGRNRFEFFTKALEAEVVSTKHMADDILTGIEERQFTAHYQPQFDAVTREMVGLEALIRWNHPTEGLLVPARFLKVAEDINALPILDHLVLETALAHRLNWIAAGLRVPRIAVNVSMGRLRDERVIDMLKMMPIEPGMLSFELTEAIYLDDRDDIVSDNIRSLKDLGIEIEIDDFGTGYASIVSLMRLQPSRLKIAHQLTSAVSSSFAQRQLIRAIVEIGRTKGIGVVAEGVETMEQADILADLGCQTLQGYALGRPVDANALAHLMLHQRDPLGAGRTDGLLAAEGDQS
ncbi:putative bifunctional diguanylate cyclase/phosphodiesterase [Pleomorphomonas sp. PLEO]|uniref:putative bifunctional diguanylate cyclase/phosphodiesterase n=1 Tax=Pleomorphomonas sp. PLEO TaxID=3239306 RepID=UPI00351E357A